MSSRRRPPENRPGAPMTDREALVARYLPLARHLARRFSGGPEPLEDLEQVAAIGLLKAIDRHDPTARRLHVVRRADHHGRDQASLSDHGWHIHLPRTLQERTLDMRRVEAAAVDELGHSPTPTELAKRLGWTIEAVLEVRAAAAASHIRSLDEPCHTADEETRLGDCLGAADPRLLTADDLLLVRDSLKRLPPRDRMILVLRLEHDLTQQEIAACFGSPRCTSAASSGRRWNGCAPSPTGPGEGALRRSPFSRSRPGWSG